MSTCSQCIYRRENSQLNGGGLVCRASPPTVFMVQGPQGYGFASAFPPVTPEMSCGLFEADIGDVPGTDTSPQ